MAGARARAMARARARARAGVRARARARARARTTCYYVKDYSKTIILYSHAQRNNFLGKHQYAHTCMRRARNKV